MGTGSRKVVDVDGMRILNKSVMVPWVMKSKANGGGPSEKVYQRYYHLYRKGELEESVQQAGGEVLRVWV